MDALLAFYYLHIHTSPKITFSPAGALCLPCCPSDWSRDLPASLPMSPCERGFGRAVIKWWSLLLLRVSILPPLSLDYDVFIRWLDLGTLTTVYTSLKSKCFGLCGFSCGFSYQRCPSPVGNWGTLIISGAWTWYRGARSWLLVEMGRGNGGFVPLLGFGESQVLVGRRWGRWFTSLIS